jgi:polyphosphate kinase
MKRNLEHRVETLAPVEDATARQALRAVLDLQLAPNRNAWLMQSDGSYARAPADPADRGCQQALLDWVAARDTLPATAARPRKRRFPNRRSA